MLRPAMILPMHGIKSKTPLYRVMYSLLTPVYPLLSKLSPKYVTTTERVGRAMLRLARTGFTARVLEAADIDMLGARPVASVSARA
jgi:hypothetical protein